MTMTMDMAGKFKKKMARTTCKAQGRLLLFWVGCVCLMGVLYGHMCTIHTTKPPKWALICQVDLEADQMQLQVQVHAFSMYTLVFLYL